MKKLISTCDRLGWPWIAMAFVLVVFAGFIPAMTGGIR